MEEDYKKILVAVDGSQQSLSLVRYVCRMTSFKPVELVLFHVFCSQPENYWDMADYPGMHSKISYMNAWAASRKAEMMDFMDVCVAEAKVAGIAGKLITPVVSPRKHGVARDILAEAKNGYNAVAIGRKGHSRIKDLVLGSTSEKLVNKLSGVPLWLVGGHPSPKKIMVAVDASRGALRAVDHVAEMLGQSDIQVVLLHVIRGFSYGLGYGRSEEKSGPQQKELLRAGDDMDRQERIMEKILQDMRLHMIGQGIKADRIQISIVKDVASRAMTVVEEARALECDTIVMGRRGLSRVEEFFLGRVSSKVIQMSTQAAVWLVH